MACSIQRNPQGRITDVLDSNGNSSRLFRQIHGTLFLADVDSSLRIYSNIYTDDMQQKFNGNEPSLVYSSNGNIYSDLETLLLEQPDGKITLGVIDPVDQSLIELATVDNSRGMTSQLSSLVRQGYLSAERTLTPEGETVYSGKGEFSSTRRWTAEIATRDLIGAIGQGTFEVNDLGQFTIKNYNEKYTEVLDINGKPTIVEKSQIPTLIKEGKIGNVPQAYLEYVYEFEHPRELDSVVTERTQPKVDVKSLETGLLNFLKSLGFSTATMEEYRKNYNTKYGKDPDITAIADIANQVVAGDLSNLDNLSEEVAHIAIEMYNDQSSIAGALASVHLTSEYAEFYAQYKEKYSKFYEGIELEDQIRKEILGKILKKSIQERFSTRDKTEGQSYVIMKLKEIWDSVMKFIKSRITRSHFQTLDILNNKIAQSILENRSEDFTQDISENTNFFYNLMSKEAKTIEKQLKVAQYTIENLYRTALEEQFPDASALEALSDASSEYDLLSGINTIVGVASHQVNILRSNIETADRQKGLVSKKDASRYIVLSQNLIPTIDTLKVALGKVQFSQEISKGQVNNLIKIMGEVSDKMTFITPLMQTDNDRLIEQVVEGELSRTVSLTEEQKDDVREQMNGGFRDLTTAGKLFGLNSHLQNPLLQFLAKTLSAISTRVTTKFNSIFNDFINEVEDKGWAQYGKSIIQKGTHYFESPLDRAAMDKDLDEAQTKIIASILGKDPKDIAKLRKKSTEKDILGTDENFTKYKEEVKLWRDTEGSEQRRSAKYYEDREKRFQLAQTHKSTQAYLSSKNSARYQRNKKYENPDGTIDYSKRTQSEKEQDEAEKKAYFLTKSPVDSIGNVKPGLLVVRASELTDEQRASMPIPVEDDYLGNVIILKEGQLLDDLPMESRKVIDIFNLDMLYLKESKENPTITSPTASFQTAIEQKEKQGGSAAYDWVQDNGSIRLTSEYYETMDEPVTYNNKAQEYIDSIEDSEERSKKQAQLDNLKESQRLRMLLLKQNKYSNSAIETDVHSMVGTTRRRIIELDADIAEARRSIKLPEEYQAEITEMEGESEVNEDFNKLLIESGLSVYEFSLQHMTPRNTQRAREFAQQLEDNVAGNSTSMKSRYDDFINEMISEGRLTGMTREEAMIELKGLFAKRYVASYFKRYQPSGYSLALEKLKTGSVKISEMISNREEFVKQNPEFRYLEIVPDYSWSDNTVNPEYENPNFKDGLPVVPKVSKYLNKKFFQKYGIPESQYLDSKIDDLRLLTPTKNIKEYEFLVKMVSLNEEILKIYGEEGKVSKYQRPQISKKAFEKHLSAYAGGGKLIKKNVRDFFKDVATSRKDELEYGVEIDNLGASDIDVKLIPKYYLSQLEDPDFVTENSIEAVMVAYKAALRFQERNNSERQVKALEYKIGEQVFVNSGGIRNKSKITKKGQVTNYYQKAEELVNYALYGVRENRKLSVEVAGVEIDLTQIFNRFTKFVTNVSLGFSPIVDITSYTTGVYNNLLDRAGGELYGREAADLATKNISSMATSYLMESGSMAKTSDLNHLMEFTRIFGAEDRVQDSSQNRGVRLAGRLRFAGSKAANIPITARNMLAVLYDYKFYNGNFVSFQDFTRLKKISDPTITPKDIKALWKKENDRFIDNLTIDKKQGVRMNDKFKSKFDNPEQEFQIIQEALIDKITQINQNVDSIISETDQTMAQRDVLLSSMMVFRSWIVIGLTKKFKNKHFNFTTGQFDEGQYRSNMKVARKMFQSLGRNGSIKEFIKSLEVHEASNLKRTAMEVIVISLLIGISKGLLAADDDDDTFIENLAQLIALRTTSEAQSSSLIGVFGETASVYDDPLVQARYLENFKRGITGEPIYLLKNTYYKRYEQLSDLQKQVESYQFFNRSTLVGIDPKE
jgi:hypothetical protein